MFKKSLMLIVVIGTLAIMAFGAASTGAWFTDSATIDNNVVATGDLNLTAWGGPLQVSNLEPGAAYVSAGVFCAKNEGDYNMKWRAKINLSRYDNFINNYILVKVVLNPAGQVGNYGPAGQELFTNVALNDLLDYNGYLKMNDAQWPFAPGYWACYDVQVALSQDAPNAVQNSTLVGQIYLDATQYISDAWQ